jgi:acetoin utilization protein AcuB
MYVEQFMSSQVFTIRPSDNIQQAANLMKTKNISRLPVMQGDKLVGIVTDGDIRAATPSPVTTLSKYEMTDLLSKVTVGSIIGKKIITCPVGTLIEDAAELMQKYRIGALPVIDDDDTIAGIISESDIVRAFLDVMGSRSPGERLVIEAHDKVGTFHHIASIIVDAGVDITSLSVYHMPNRRVQILLRLNGERTEQVVEALRMEYDIL